MTGRETVVVSDPEDVSFCIIRDEESGDVGMRFPGTVEGFLCSPSTIRKLARMMVVACDCKTQDEFMQAMDAMDREGS